MALTSVELDRFDAEAPPGDVRAPDMRLAKLLDAGGPIPLHAPDDSGVLAVRGTVHGEPVVAFCTEAARMGGAMGQAGCRHIVLAIETAVREHVPVIGLWHCGGARLGEGIGGLEAVGQVFAAMIRASGKVLQLSVVLGPAAGGAAYGPALTDIVVMSSAGRIFVTGPDVVRSVTGEDIDMEGLGGPTAHGAKSGVVHLVTETEAQALARARAITHLFARPGVFDLESVRAPRDLAPLLPERARRAYDVRPLLRRVLDADCVVEELQALWAPNIVVALGRLGGRTVGVLANNPLRKAGCLDALSAEKGARFVRMCDSLGVPLLVVVDVPGYLPGVDQEWGGVVRRGAKLLYAFGESSVPRVTVVVRKSFGGAYIAMNSRSLGATAVFAWPDAEVAVMGADAAVGILHRKQLAAAAEEERPALRSRLADSHRRDVSGLHHGLATGAIDEVIDPADTRRRVAEALAAAPPGRGRHGNIPL
jgi:acetyl-CoA/propionyl-CoA carboxylase carboxyl transferase subunit